MTLKTYEPVDGLDARSVTVNLLDQAESAAKGNAEAIMIIGNSMLAAAKLLFARSGIDEVQRSDLYQEFWRPLVVAGIEE